MPTPKPADVDAYRAALVKVRAAMRRALPASAEAIKYGMPAYLVDGRAIASFAGWKNHYALYFVSSALFDAQPYSRAAPWCEHGHAVGGYHPPAVRRTGVGATGKRRQ